MSSLDPYLSKFQPFPTSTFPEPDEMEKLLKSIRYENQIELGKNNLLVEYLNQLQRMEHLKQQQESLLKEIRTLTAKLGLTAKDEEVGVSEEEETSKGSEESSKKSTPTVWTSNQKKFSFTVAVSKD